MDAESIHCMNDENMSDCSVRVTKRASIARVPTGGI